MSDDGIEMRPCSSTVTCWLRRETLALKALLLVPIDRRRRFLGSASTLHPRTTRGSPSRPPTRTNLRDAFRPSPARSDIGTIEPSLVVDRMALGHRRSTSSRPQVSTGSPVSPVPQNHHWGAMYACGRRSKEKMDPRSKTVGARARRRAAPPDQRRRRASRRPPSPPGRTSRRRPPDGPPRLGTAALPSGTRPRRTGPARRSYARVERSTEEPGRDGRRTRSSTPLRAAPLSSSGMIAGVTRPAKSTTRRLLW